MSNSGEKVGLDVFFSTMNKFKDATSHKDWDKKIASLVSVNNYKSYSGGFRCHV